MKTTRRGFLRNISATAAGIPLASSVLSTTGFSDTSTASSDSPQEVPATLDLVERGNLALNGLIGTLDWGNVPEFYFRTELAPPTFIHDAISFAACGPKYWEALVMMRAMTGSQLHEDMEARYKQYMLSCIEEDGLFYCKIGPQRPWDTSSPEDYANIYGQGRMIRALLAQHDYDGNPEWLKRARKIENRLAEIAISEDNYVYYPTTPGYGDIFSYPKSGWKVTAVPTDASFGIPMYLGGTILPLVRLAERLEDEEALELATRLTRFVLLPESGWMPDGYPRGVTPSDHGEYRGHFHGHVMALRGILACGVATNDTGMKEFARDGYEFSRNLGISSLGWFEEVAGKHSHETCCLADMVSLALRLCEAGLGDYWDDVDGYARNHLTEGQFTDLNKMKQINSDLTADQEKLLERSIGTYCGWGTPVALSTVLQNCCMANGAQSLYSIWDSIVRFEDTTAKVNLLLNRRSPWLDVESYLPYQGRVVLRNKQARHIFIRIPGWVDRQEIKCLLDGQPTELRFLGNYLVLDPVRSPATVVLTFPIHEEVRTFTLDEYGPRGDELKPAKYKYRVSFRAGTAITVTSLDGDQAITYEGSKLDVSAIYSAYQDRGRLAQNVAPLKVGHPVITSNVIRSW
jgi:Beta-L-arabinofuranosidase, GH127